jgi:hypothetical protein
VTHDAFDNGGVIAGAAAVSLPHELPNKLRGARPADGPPDLPDVNLLPLRLT